jgi:hypothetical protein
MGGCFFCGVTFLTCRSLALPLSFLLLGLTKGGEAYLPIFLPSGEADADADGAGAGQPLASPPGAEADVEGTTEVIALLAEGRAVEPDAPL